MSSVKFGLIGNAGHWGRNLVKSLKSLNFDLVSTCDLVYYPNDCPHYENIDEFLEKTTAEAIIIATAPNLHAQMIRKCLEANKHIWCEKPLVLDSKRGFELISLADEKKLIIHVDDTWLYSRELMFLKECVRLNRFGKILNVKMRWANLGREQSCGVFNDLLSHSISKCFHLFGLANYVSATGTKKYINEKENVYVDGAAVISYDDFKVNCEVSWISDRKVRHLEIITSEGTLITDFTGQVDFIKRGSNNRTIYRPVDLGSPLEVELIHFSECVKEKRNTISSGFVGARIVEVLEKVIESANNGGKEEKLR